MIDHHGGVRSIEKGACLGFVKAHFVQLFLKVAIPILDILCQLGVQKIEAPQSMHWDGCVVELQV